MRTLISRRFRQLLEVPFEVEAEIGSGCVVIKDSPTVSAYTIGVQSRASAERYSLRRGRAAPIRLSADIARALL